MAKVEGKSKSYPHWFSSFMTIIPQKLFFFLIWKCKDFTQRCISPCIPPFHFPFSPSCISLALFVFILRWMATPAGSTAHLTMFTHPKSLEVHYLELPPMPFPSLLSELFQNAGRLEKVQKRRWKRWLKKKYCVYINIYRKTKKLK